MAKHPNKGLDNSPSKKRGTNNKALWTFLFITLVSAATFGLLTRSGQKTLDAWHDYFRSKQNWVYFKFNRPLPGTPDLSQKTTRLAKLQLKEGDPIFMRVFKLEGKLELWMAGSDGFKLFATYPICRWSGGLGPKLKEGDGQSPEGIYTVKKNQLNPNSRWYRSFNLGYPNPYDKSYNRTGSFLMVHGGCSSIGCYAMTNPVMKEIWEIVLASYKGGQKSFTVHAFPFHMTERNMRVYDNKKWNPLWQDLKQAYDLFNETQVPPEVSVCNKRYIVTKGDLKKKSFQQSIKSDCTNLEISKLKSQAKAN